jgi:DNA-binding response OmpR family regulator
MTCARCAELEARLREIESASRVERGVRLVAELATRLSLEPQPAALLAALYTAKGRVLSRDYLLDEALPAGRVDTRTAKHLDVMIVRVRRATGFDGVRTIPGLGYAITELGRAVCDEALERQAVAA